MRRYGPGFWPNDGQPAGYAQYMPSLFRVQRCATALLLLLLLLWQRLRRLRRLLRLLVALVLALGQFWF